MLPACVLSFVFLSKLDFCKQAVLTAAVKDHVTAAENTFKKQNNWNCDRFSITTDFFKSQPDKDLHNVLKNWELFEKLKVCFFKQKPRNYTIHLSNLTRIHLTTFMCKFDIESQDLQRLHAGDI